MEKGREYLEVAPAETHFGKEDDDGHSADSNAE